MYGCFAFMYIYTCMPDTPGPKMVSDPLELEI